MTNEITAKLKATVTFSKKYYWPLLLFSVPVILFFYILESIIPLLVSNENVSLFFNIMLTFIYNGIFYSLLIYIIDCLHNNKLVSVADIKIFVKNNFTQMAAAVILISLFSIAGLFLFIIPGIYLYARLAIAPYLLCLDQTGFQHSFYTSYQYSKRYTWLIFLSSLFISIPEVILAFDQFVTLYFSTWLYTIVSYLTSILQTILIYHFYSEIKTRINLQTI